MGVRVILSGCEWLTSVLSLIYSRRILCCGGLNKLESESGGGSFSKF